VKIALDAMGGDLAPKAIIEGAVLAARDLAVEMVLVGDREAIELELHEHRTQGLAITVEHAAQVVAMDDSPLESVLSKPDSSIHVGLELVKQGRADAFVSAGNSGAVMTAAMAILGTLPGVDRPAIASLVPTSAGFALLIDAGANTDVKPINLLQFGVMGSVYWKHVHQADHPRVAVLSNGEEESKGTELTRTAAQMLAAMAPAINYVGYVEGRDINRARADVVVTDGSTGNVALKTTEGFHADESARIIFQRRNAASWLSARTQEAQRDAGAARSGGIWRGALDGRRRRNDYRSRIVQCQGDS
jgi:phosphate acyltransferase